AGAGPSGPRRARGRSGGVGAGCAQRSRAARLRVSRALRLPGRVPRPLLREAAVSLRAAGASGPLHVPRACARRGRVGRGARAALRRSNRGCLDRRRPNWCPPPGCRRPLRSLSELRISRLEGAELHDQLDSLAAVLADCVAGGASVSYLEPFSHEDARAAFEEWADEVERGRRVILPAFDGSTLVGTVQLILAVPPNQPHR